MMRRGALRAGPVALAIGLFSDPVHAQTCPAPEGADASLASKDQAARLSFLQRSLDHAAEKSSGWTWSWRTVFYAATVAQWTYAPFATKQADRVDAIAGGAKSFLGLSSSFVVTLASMKDARALEVAVRERNTCDAIAEGERLLAHSAAAEAKGRSITLHALGFGLNIGVAIAVGIIHKRWLTAVGGGVLGSIVGETRIWTQPMIATESLARYRKGDLVEEAPTATVVPMIALGPSSIDLGVAIGF